ncbi:hypothetical protein [Nocardia sp. NPDC059239]|uniref:hypothetical protein n=1 Tax=Nocardia sp. NPDC059239 TaxID=3346785 RepID=UPI003686CE27
MFSLGSLLVMAATRSSPFAGGSLAYRLFNIVHTEPNLEQVSPELCDFIAACLNRDPRSRRRLSARWLSAAAALLLVANVAAGVSWVGLSHHAPHPNSAPPVVVEPILAYLRNADMCAGCEECSASRFRRIPASRPIRQRGNGVPLLSGDARCRPAVSL